MSAVTDIRQIKSKMKATWEDGNYAEFASYMEPGAIEIVQGWNLGTGRKLLDVGCGSGPSALASARDGHQVTGADIAENLIEYARDRASSEGLSAQFDVGDAENLPYEDASFDVVISLIGAMFAPRPEAVVSELARVLKPGGKLCMANWTPDGLPAGLFKAVAQFVPPPPVIAPPVLWGDENVVANRLTGRFKDIRLTRKLYPQWQYPFGPPQVYRLFEQQFGPVKRACEVIEEGQRRQLQRQIEQLFNDHSDQEGNTMTVKGGEYLEVIAIRQ